MKQHGKAFKEKGKSKVILLKRMRHGKKSMPKFSEGLVSTGYYRNFLKKKKYAVIFSEEDHNKIQLFKTEEKENKAKETFSLEKIEGKPLFFARQAGGTGVLYASVNKKQICEALKTEYGVDVNTQHVFIDNPIKTIGIYQIGIESENRDFFITVSVGTSIENAKNNLANNTKVEKAETPGTTKPEETTDAKGDKNE